MNIRFLRVVWLLGSLLAFTFAANAQTSVANVHVPFEFAAGGKMLPAGDYSIESPELSGVLLIRGRAGNSVAVLATAGAPGTATSTVKLTFERRGAELYLCVLELPDETVTLVSPMISPAKATASAVPPATPQHQ
jgi:hypothetical protein